MKKIILENNEITILIVLYKETYGLISKTLETLKSFKKIIIDNGCDQGLKKKIESSYEIESYILNKANIGFSAGYNQAIKLCKTEFCLILGPDCIIEKKAIVKLYEAYVRYDKCFMVAPTSYNEDNELTYTGGPLPENSQKDKVLNLSGDTCVQSVLGACMLIKTNDIKEIEMFDENFFLYYSDDDLCRKIRKINKSIIQIYNAKCNHTHGLLVETNKYLKTFIREYNLTHDALYYYHKVDDTKYLNIVKKKTKNYLYKFILKLLSLQLEESVKIFSRLFAYYKFKLRFKRRDGRAV
jgi:N-acetylglucosaminyl-diphospho-decaprenol L-rhamnosyltransferase